MDNGRPNVYVDVVFSRETFLKYWDYQIHPMLGKEMWPECNYAEIKPPHITFKLSHSTISMNVATVRNVTELLLSGLEIHILKNLEIVPYRNPML